MKNPNLKVLKAAFILAFCGCATLCLLSQDRPGPGPGEFPPDRGPRGFGPGGPGGPGGMMGQNRPVLKQFDKDGNGRLDLSERKAAREFLQTQRGNGPGGRRFGGPPGGEDQEPASKGKELKPEDVKAYPDANLYDPSIIRTFFLQFEAPDWEKELIAFNNTDVEIPATIQVDGKVFKDVGVHVRGMSSSMVPEGRKHSFNLSFDWLHKDQNIRGYRTMNVLNSHEDPSFLRSFLYSTIARDYIPTPRANFVRLVINGENWGIYVNSQQFNKDFLDDNFKTTKGNRWKASGSPNGRATLGYIGDDPAPYKRIYSLKTKENPKAWTDLIQLCKIISTTPADKLEEALAPVLDIDGALKFLAIENALVNNDGYWIRTSDYAIYQDPKGKFHIVPHDMNEGFSRPGGPGFGGRGGGRGFRGGPPGGGPPPGDVLIGAGPEGDRRPDRNGSREGGPGPGPGGGGGGGDRGGRQQIQGVKLDPLYAANDEGKPLISKLLAVPSLRSKYLGHVRDIAEKWLDWNKLGPIAEKYHNMLVEDVRMDTHKLESFDAFEKSLTLDIAGRGFGPGGGGTIALKNFADQRREYLLEQTKAVAGKK